MLTDHFQRSKVLLLDELVFSHHLNSVHNAVSYQFLVLLVNNNISEAWRFDILSLLLILVPPMCLNKTSKLDRSCMIQIHMLEPTLVGHICGNFKQS